MKTTNRKHFGKRHFPVRFALCNTGLYLLEVVAPWVVIVVMCALVAQCFVELFTKK